jgi:SAM-dependent methyltransferase
MFERLLSRLRRIRRQTAGWSVRDDRTFHDGLFGTARHDAFDRSFPGSITIRRFADLAAERLGDARAVLDLGCGPGEITCELARRHPAVRFTGVDHSAVAIERATATAARLGAGNVRFETADLTRYRPPGPVDLITMFDAFHHVLDPAAFVARMSPYADRFLLIEPAGDALGRWRRTLDFDWVPAELDKIRARIEHAIGAAAPHPDAPGETPANAAGRAIENRYPEADYRRFFNGFALEIRGTVAGFDVYPPAPYYSSPWRARMMDLAGDLIADIERELYARSLDVYAKHWVIHAGRGGTIDGARPARRPEQTGDAPTAWRVQGAYDAVYPSSAIPSTLPLGQDVTVEVTIRNQSWRVWTSEGLDHPVLISHHWLDAGRRPVDYDGLRTPLPRPLAPGDECVAAVRVRTPPRPGGYLLEIDLVEEGVSWFSAAGVPPLRVTVRVE